MANGINQETNAVIAKMNGQRTLEGRLAEYFGISEEDLGKSVKLKRTGVRYFPQLAKLGVSLETFKDYFKDTLELDDQGQPVTNDNGKPQPDPEDHSGDDDGADELKPVETLGKKFGRKKKGLAEDVPSPVGADVRAEVLPEGRAS